MSDVNATAQVGDGANQSLGEYVGKGMMSFDGHVFTFDTHDNGDYGIIMGIYSILPDIEYNARGVDYANCLLEVEDFFQPEYDRLGFQSVPTKVFRAVNSNVQSTDGNITRGFAPNYWYYKYSLDKVHGEFQHDIFMTGNMRQWSTTLNVLSSNRAVSVFDFYVNSHVFDDLFVQRPLFEVDDQGVSEVNNFFVDLYFNVSSIRPMSVLGLPQI